MNAVIVGYGRMGKLLEQELNERKGIEICEIIDKENWTDGSLKEADVAIVFVSPEAGYKVVKRILKAGVDAIVGTTKFYLNRDGSENEKMLQEFEDLAEKNSCRIIISPNFAIGMNAFWEIMGLAAGILAGIEYDVAVEERHHNKKADISGTAKKIGEILLDYFPEKSSLNFGDCERKIREDEITITSTRVGHTPGRHTVIFDSPVDTIEMTHTVRDPRIFVDGAIKAAFWLQPQAPGLYRISNMFSHIV